MEFFDDENPFGSSMQASHGWEGGGQGEYMLSRAYSL